MYGQIHNNAFKCPYCPKFNQTQINLNGLNKHLAYHALEYDKQLSPKPNIVARFIDATVTYVQCNCCPVFVFEKNYGHFKNEITSHGWTQRKWEPTAFDLFCARLTCRVKPKYFVPGSKLLTELFGGKSSSVFNSFWLQEKIETIRRLL